MATLAIGSAARRARAPFTALLASIVVLAGGALGAGAATIALTMLRLAQGQQAAAGPPTVRTVYLVIDAVLLVLIGSFLVHAARARTRRQRLERTAHSVLFVGRTIVADALAIRRPATTRGASEPRSDLARQPQPA